MHFRGNVVRPAALLLSVAGHLALATAVGTSSAGRDSIRRSDVVEAEPLAHVSLMEITRTETGARGVHALPPGLRAEPLGVIPHAQPGDQAPDRRTSAAMRPSQRPKHGETVHYFALAELTEKPVVLQDVPADIAGSVPDVIPNSIEMELLINSNGGIDEVIIEDAILSKSAKQLIRKSFAEVKFRPGKIGTMPVPSRMRIEVALKSTVAVTVSQVH